MRFTPPDDRFRPQFTQKEGCRRNPCFAVTARAAGVYTIRGSDPFLFHCPSEAR